MTDDDAKLVFAHRLLTLPPNQAHVGDFRVDTGLAQPRRRRSSLGLPSPAEYEACAIWPHLRQDHYAERPE